MSATEERPAARPILLAVDDDPAVARAVNRDLRRHYGARYRVLSTASGQEALNALEEITRRGEPVALLLADQRMPQMTGVEFMAEARALAPDARRVLLTAYADSQAAIDAINRVGLDRYLMKPWDPPEEQLYPALDDLLAAWHATRPAADDGLRVIGHRFSRASHELRDFLARNLVPFRYVDVERDAARAAPLLAAAGLDGDEPEGLPLVLLEDGEALRAPDVAEVARRVGISRPATRDLYDLVVVGGGPAGLAAAVYGASEGLATALVERVATGGQAGQSSRIENYLGFPGGLSGAELTDRATQQARKFGAEMLLVRDVEGLEARDGTHVLRLGDGSELAAHAVVVATGVEYRRLEAPGVDELTGRGIYYGASRSEGQSCADEHVVVIGGANSAGQAAMYFSQFARQVTILYRGDSLAKSMSHYLVQQIAEQPNIVVRTNAELTAAHGTDRLEAIDVGIDRGASSERLDASSVFVFIGAAPQTDWLGDAVARDARGFVLTGGEAAAVAGRGPAPWPLERPPFELETSAPGVFAAGDVRSESIKRCASAVGEGSMAVQFVHRYLATP